MSEHQEQPRATSGSLLDVEDEDQRHQRIRSFLEKLNAQPSSSSANGRTSTHNASSGPLKFDFGDRTTYPVSPPTELLSRVQNFLPQIAASNTSLAGQDPTSINMEHLPPNAEQYIEMNLGLGVFQTRPSPSITTTTTYSGTMYSIGQGQEKSGREVVDVDVDMSSSDSDSDTDTDYSSEIITSFSLEPRVIKPLPRRSLASRVVGKPQIVVLGEQQQGVQQPEVGPGMSRPQS
ncbi:hypothetical protein AMATHDRAFT_71096 [Amanita thiersii Skay4041]|uniref:Uncharacterized protein n=1 Tax=Amanita thiersii Skay4041 TaxID=703135 RepID=A0A2A9N753_9AGAR|nr:hypothetical protein AMATHDRAFT_71096 [Amanita thiersii Skay4041]